MTEQARKLEWGLQPDREFVCAWGARAILEQDHAGWCRVDILHDRQSVDGSKEDLRRLVDWVNDTAVPLVRKRIREEGIEPRDRVLIEIDRPGLRLIANPNASYGYLYLCAMVLKQEAQIA